MPLTVQIPETEFWDEAAERFLYSPSVAFTIEYSLDALRRWEAKWKKPLLGNETVTGEEFLDFVRMMTLEKDIPEVAYRTLRAENLRQIQDYMADPMTATTISKANKKTPGPMKIITAEVIYYDMVELGIPFECQYWHLNQLMMLIAVCAEKNNPPKKMSKRDQLSQYTSLNAARKARLGTRG